MKLSNLYEEMMIKDAWTNLEKALQETMILDEANNKLMRLIKESDNVLFKAFGINPSDKKYFISGSGRLYMYDGLPEFINKISEQFGGKEMPLEPGDLDVVVPNKENWETLKLNLNNKVDMDKFNSNYDKGIYRPQELGLTQMDIEAFDEWAPQRAGGDYTDTKVDDTETILNRATELNGYYFMSLYDVISYKYQMGREKEKRIADLINDFLKRREGRSKEQLFNIIARIIKMRYS